MRSKEEAKEAGDKLRSLLLELVVARRKAIGKLNGLEFLKKSKESVDLAIQSSVSFVEDRLKDGLGDNLFLSKGRLARNFDFEVSRLWGRALNLYVCSNEKALGEKIEGFLESEDNRAIRERMKRQLEGQVRRVIAEAFKDHEDPAGYLLFYTHYLMLDHEKGMVVENIAKTGVTPPELSTTFFGIFCLLAEAESKRGQGDLEVAYSYMIDAAELIGMHEGASYVMKNLDEVAAKRRGKINGERSRYKKNKEQVRACELFYSLRPCDKEGVPIQWKNAAAAFEEVWGALVKEAIDKGLKDPISAESTIQTLCRELCKRDKDGSSLDVRVEVVQLLPDGAEIKVPLD